MPTGVFRAVFAVYLSVHIGTALLFLGFGLLTRRQLGVSAPLWIAAIMTLHQALGMLHTGWNTELVDRFMTDTPPLDVSVGTAITLVSLGGQFLLVALVLGALGSLGPGIAAWLLSA